MINVWGLLAIAVKTLLVNQLVVKLPVCS